MTHRTKDKVVVVGLGYVGMATAQVLSKTCHVVGLDVDADRVAQINRGISPVEDPTAPKDLGFEASTNPEEAYRDALFAVICVPTDGSGEEGLDGGIVSQVVAEAVHHGVPNLVIKSTVPVGTAHRLAASFPGKFEVLSAPEFLREGSAYADMSAPSRVVIGHSSSPEGMEAAEAFCDLLPTCSIRDGLVLCGNPEAEAIKLFSNAYLAMRVAYFNEVDTYAIRQGLSAEDVVAGITLDPRIGSHYCNPSFGYGGYCLPKDTSQVAQYAPTLFNAVQTSNAQRLLAVARQVLMESQGEPVGIHLLGMKAGSDNRRESTSVELLDRLVAWAKPVVVYDPALVGEEVFHGAHVAQSVEELVSLSGLVATNRVTPELREALKDAPEVRLFSRDLFGTN